MDPFFAHYQDQDWKKRDRERTFREGAEITSEESIPQSPNQQADETATKGGQWHKKQNSAFGLDAVQSWNIYFLISAAGGQRTCDVTIRKTMQQEHECKEHMQSRLSVWLPKQTAAQSCRLCWLHFNI